MKKNKEILHDSRLEIERLITDDTDFNTVETYKAIRTNIMFSMQKTEKGKIIAVTSAIPGEGKTTTSINLAITFAQMGAKVILVDCDLRKARVHRYLELDRCDGVSNILCGFTELEHAVKTNIRENFDVLTAGEIPPNPVELLESSEFFNLIENLKNTYDYVFIDTPPVTVVTDAVVVAKHCEGIVLVIRENKTTFDMLDNAIDFIGKSGARIIGAVMVGGESKVKKYKYYKNKRNGYGYAKGYGYNYNYYYGDEPKPESVKKQ